MPGSVLIFDPQMTNRLMLKAQLSRDFFQISTIADEQEFHQHLRRSFPDVILMSYSAERAQGFKNLHRIRSDSTKPYVPIIFLHSGEDPRIWEQSHDCLVDDVLPYSTEHWLMTTRINLLIRGKEKVQALAERYQTISDMGFAEEAVCFPPLRTQAVTLDFTKSTTAFPSGFLYDLTTLLVRDFPSIDVLSSTTPDPAGQHSSVDVHIVDETNLGRDKAYATLCELRSLTPSSSILFCCPPDVPQSAIKALELGATDFTTNEPSASEIACRLRRLIWMRQASLNADQSVSKHLKSALLDPLTGLYNRRYAQQHINRLISNVQNRDQSITAMVIDLDRFKTINDTYGHLSGDAVLQQTAERLTRNLREPDLIARLGGEEFLIVLKETPAHMVRDIAERLRKEISGESFKSDSGQDIFMSASIGVSATKSHWPSANAIIDSADLALYRSKDEGRNRVTICDKAA